MNTSQPSKSNKRTIRTHQKAIEELTTEALQAIVETNIPPLTFVKGGNLVRVRTDEMNRILVELIDEKILNNILERSASFSRHKNNLEVPCNVPLQVVKDLLALPSWEGIPPLIDVTETPILRSDGTVLATPGYDAVTGLFYSPPQDFILSPIPDNPTAEDINNAITLIKEMLAQFPFDTDADFCNAVALALTPLVRPIIEGPIPMAVITAPQVGTGKSLLGEIVSLIATGHSPELMQYTTQEDEIRKKITAALMQSAQIIMFDNIAVPLMSSTLASALTSIEWGDRILGQSKNVRLPQRATWIANGNNLRIGEELVRRSYRITLNAKMSAPYLRNNFFHPNLPGWVLEKRGQLLAAGFNLIRAWFSSGKPRFHGASFGNFTEWAETLGGILENVSITGFLGNLNTMHEELLTNQNQWEIFISQLYNVFLNNEFSTAELCTYLVEDPSRQDTLPENIALIIEDDKVITSAQKTKIGRELGKISKKRFGEESFYLVSRQDKSKKVSVWRVCRGDTGGTEA